MDTLRIASKGDDGFHKRYKIIENVLNEKNGVALEGLGTSFH